MSWQTEIVENIRVLINDLDSSAYTYTDDRLQRVTIIGANQVIQEVSFDAEYVIDIANASITPDPTSSDTKDYGFINLVSFKAAVLILNGELKQYSLAGGVSISDGPSSISTTGLFKNIQEVAKGMNQAYALAKMEYKMAQSSIHSQIISTPCTILTNNFGYPGGDPRASYGSIY